MKDKKKSDRIIDFVALASAIAFFSGILILIWIGLIGLKISLSGLAIFLADCAAYFWFSTENKKQGGGRGRG